MDEKNDGAAYKGTSSTEGSVSALTLRVRNLEHFMEVVAREVSCLPDYNDSLPELGNAHIIRAIKKLKQNYGG